MVKFVFLSALQLNRGWVRLQQATPFHCRHDMFRRRDSAWVVYRCSLAFLPSSSWHFFSVCAAIFRCSFFVLLHTLLHVFVGSHSGSPALLLTSGNRKRAKDVKRGEITVWLVEEGPMFNFPLFLLPQVEGLRLEEVVAEAQQICITVATTTVPVPCPACGVASSRVQSRYQRTVADLPWAEMAIRLLVRVRRFRCDNPGCPRAIFCERLGPTIAAYARRTQRLERWLQRVGLALGGEAGGHGSRRRSDHARPGHGAVLATQETLDLMRLRYGENFAGTHAGGALRRKREPRRRHGDVPSGRPRARLGAGRGRARRAADRRVRRLQGRGRSDLRAVRAGPLRRLHHRGDLRRCRCSATAIRTARSPSCCARSRCFPSARIWSAPIRSARRSASSR